MLRFLVRTILVVGYLSWSGSLSAVLLAPEMKNFTASLGTLEGALQKFINPHTDVKKVPRIQVLEAQLKEAIAKAQRDLITFETAVQDKTTSPDDKIKYGRLLLSDFEVNGALEIEITSELKEGLSGEEVKHLFGESEKFRVGLQGLQNKFKWFDLLHEEMGHAGSIIERMVALGNELSEKTPKEREAEKENIKEFEKELKTLAVFSDKVKNPVNDRFLKLEATKTYNSKSAEIERKFLKRQKEKFAFIEEAALANYSSFIGARKNNRAVDAQKSLRTLKFDLDTIINDNIKAEMIEEEAKARESEGEEEESDESADTSIIESLEQTVDLYLRGVFRADREVMSEEAPEGELAYDAVKFKETLESITAHVPSLYLSKADELIADILRAYNYIHGAVNKKFSLQSRLQEWNEEKEGEPKEIHDAIQGIEKQLSDLDKVIDATASKIFSRDLPELIFWAKNPQPDALTLLIEDSLDSLIKEESVDENKEESVDENKEELAAKDKTLKILINRRLKRLLYMAKVIVGENYSDQLARNFSATSTELEAARKANKMDVINEAYRKFKTLLNDAVAEIKKKHPEASTVAQ